MRMEYEVEMHATSTLTYNVYLHFQYWGKLIIYIKVNVMCTMNNTATQIFMELERSRFIYVTINQLVDALKMF